MDSWIKYYSHSEIMLSDYKLKTAIPVIYYDFLSSVNSAPFTMLPIINIDNRIMMDFTDPSTKKSGVGSPECCMNAPRKKYVINT